MSKKMMDLLRQTLVALTRQGAEQSRSRDLRKVIVGAAKLARKPGEIREMIKNISLMEEAQAREAASWMTPQQVFAGEAGRFDSCDLRNWLAIAGRAGVPAIPAREILSLTADELSLVLGGITLNHPRSDRALSAIRKGIKADFEEGELGEAGDTMPSGATLDPEAIEERVYAAMDNVPEGWMVRSHVCGGNDLKALAGCGVTETFIPEVKFGTQLEVGPGWTRRGNRRRVNVEDERTLKLYVANDTVPLTFLARPWVVASRWVEARDPHRAGTPLDIPGAWPAEWRAFVQQGKVTGVAAYYAWAGEVTPRAAQMALKVRELAQRIVDQAIADGQMARWMEAAFARMNPTGEAVLDALGYGENSFGCTLDFIEAENGPVLLEGGPACSPIGGGHPCAFAGDVEVVEVEGVQHSRMPLEGVAMRNMDHVLIAEPSTWQPGNKDGAIFSWEDIERLADPK